MLHLAGCSRGWLMHNCNPCNWDATCCTNTDAKGTASLQYKHRDACMQCSIMLHQPHRADAPGACESPSRHAQQAYKEAHAFRRLALKLS